MYLRMDEEQISSFFKKLTFTFTNILSCFASNKCNIICIISLSVETDDCSKHETGLYLYDWVINLVIHYQY